MLRYLKSSGNVFKRLFQDKIEVSIFFTAFIVEMAFGLYLVYRWGCTYIGLGDQLAHLYIARAVIDNGANSGIGQLGTVWLPLFHLLLIPFVSINALYTTGLAGTVVNSIMTGAICVLAYRLVGSRWGVVAPALILVNVKTIFSGATVIMDTTGVFFALLAVYYFKLYLEKEDLGEYMKCSLALIFGTLTRYEVWPIALLVALFFTVRELRKRRVYRLSYVHFSFWGIFVWLFYNLAIFRDPFIWVHGPFPGAEGFYGEVVGRIVHPSIQRLLAFGIPNLIRSSGFIWVVIPIALFFPLIRRDFKRFCTILLLIAPLVLIFASRRPGTFGLFSLPGIILVPLSLIRDINRRYLKIALTMCLIATYCVSIPSQYTRILHLDASNYLAYEEETALIRDTISDGSYVLASASGARSIGRALSVLYNIPQSEIINEYDGSMFEKASRKPWQYCKYVIINKGTSPSKALNDYYGCHFLYKYYHDSEWKLEFLNYYELVLETGNYLVYQLITH